MKKFSVSFLFLLLNQGIWLRVLIFKSFWLFFGHKYNFFCFPSTISKWSPNTIIRYLCKVVLQIYSENLVEFVEFVTIAMYKILLSLELIGTPCNVRDQSYLIFIWFVKMDNVYLKLQGYFNIISRILIFYF